MVSGFFTSPKDQERIISGDARPMRMASNSSVCPWYLSKFSKSFKAFPPRYSCCGRRAVSSAAAPVCWCCPLFALELDIDAQGADFFHQHIEGLRHARLHAV